MPKNLAPIFFFAAAPALAALSACAPIIASSCPIGQQAAVQDLLYFGTDKPIEHVTPEDWNQFLGETVTPRFPEGFTTWQASGQWNSSSGTIIREPSHVLSLVHPESATAEKSIEELVASYKERFHQEAVLRVSARVCISM
ncbi:MAG TPA: DUF3574 domain-containing protein [bacterium]|nr:DUF3574 domain-containing protein [bacterium]